MRLMSPENLEIELIPWDAHSESHVERLRQQRLMCGWRAESVDEWRVQQLEGRKALHWIVRSWYSWNGVNYIDNIVQVLKPNFAQYNKVLRKYKQRCPLEKDALMDTAPMMAPRATSHDFIPIGHISLDFEHYSGDKSLADPSQGIYTLSGFYISPVVRGRDFGQQAVVAIIALASGPPFYGRYLTCETVSRESSRQAERYAAFGVPMPQVSSISSSLANSRPR